LKMRNTKLLIKGERGFWETKRYTCITLQIKECGASTLTKKTKLGQAGPTDPRDE